MTLLKRTGTVLSILLLFPVLTGLWIAAEQFTGNFHEVIPGAFYRSAQPAPDDIDRLRRRYGIRSIINLRDDIAPAALAEEKAAAEKSGMAFYHFPFSSRQRLTVSDMRRLAALMRQAPGPLLVHCHHGANRTGLAAAIYVAETAGQDNFFSQWQLSPYYGHVPLPGIGRYAMNESWNTYRKTQQF